MTTSLKKAPEVATLGLSLCVPLGYNFFLSYCYYNIFQQLFQVFHLDFFFIPVSKFDKYCQSSNGMIYSRYGKSEHITGGLPSHFGGTYPPSLGKEGDANVRYIFGFDPNRYTHCCTYRSHL